MFYCSARGSAAIGTHRSVWSLQLAVGQVGGDAHLQALLRQHSRNFENALFGVQWHYLHASTSAEAKERLDRVQDAIATMFGQLNAMFEPPRGRAT
jgi:hypothetical protein